jgi:hypothetical protein
MKQKQEILAALAVLDQFAAGTVMNRQWHVQWQSLYRSVEAGVGEILSEKVEKKVGNTKKAPDA